jgi:hypothetical protein
MMLVMRSVAGLQRVSHAPKTAMEIEMKCTIASLVPGEASRTDGGCADYVKKAPAA